MRISANMRRLLTARGRRQRWLNECGSDAVTRLRESKRGKRAPEVYSISGKIILIEREQRCGPRYDLSVLLGCPPTASESATFSRAIRTMEANGLITLHREWGGVVTNLTLTDFGREKLTEVNSSVG